jgi:hypothetical protein
MAKKKIKFYNDFEDMRISRMQEIRHMSFNERQQYYSQYSGNDYKPLSRTIEIFTAFPEESLSDFYKRINGGKNN